MLISFIKTKIAFRYTIKGVIIMLKNINFTSTDTRVHKYLLPQRIMLTKGIVTHPEYLLLDRSTQVNTFEPSCVTMLSTDKERAGILLDFGVEFQGSAVIAIHSVENMVVNAGLPSADIRFSFGESANEALSQLHEKGSCNDHSPRDFVVNLSSYSSTEHGNTGYRFLYIELLTPCTLHILTIQGVCKYQPYEYLGSFSCNDEILNRIYDTAAYTCHLCIQNEIWDGIKRDRLIWIGDLSPEIKTIKYIFGNVPQIYSALETSARTAPLPRWINGFATYSLWWLVNLEEWCFYTGKMEYLDMQKEYITELTHLIINSLDEQGYFTPDDFIDWPTKGFPEAKAGTKALYLMTMEACKNMHTYFGNDELVRVCEESAAFVASTTENCGNFKQIAALLLLNNIADKNSINVLQTGGAKGFSTFMSYYILSAMAKCCSTDDILEALKEYYGAMLNLGATTFWEDFDISWVKDACRIDEIYDNTKNDVHGDNGAYCYKGYRHSLCHGWASGPVPFLTEHILGVKITEAGCKKIIIKPNLGSLSFAKGSIATPYGKLEIEHTRMPNGKIDTKITAPKEVTVIVA